MVAQRGCFETSDRLTGIVDAVGSGRLAPPVPCGYRAAMATKPAKTPNEPIDPDLDFETALADLEALVESMEAGEMSLEESLHAFERGVKLTRHCQAALKSAELKVKILTENDELVSLELDSQPDE